MVRTNAMTRGAALRFLRMTSIGLASLSTCTVMAHGYVESPISRAAACQKSINRDCGPVRYEPQSVEYSPQATSAGGSEAFPMGGPEDGQIASGGIARFSQLDLYGADQWHKTSVSAGPIEFAWRYTAEHPTAYWNYYLTKKTWDPHQPLSRQSFDPTPFCSEAGQGAMAGQRTGRSVSKCVLPNDRTGYHIVLATWKTSDTPATFYQAIDLNIGAGGDGDRDVIDDKGGDDADEPTKPIIVPHPGTIGSLHRVSRDLDAGDVVKVRAFTAAGEDEARSISLDISDRQQGRFAAWSRALAERINADRTLGYSVGSSAQLSRDAQGDDLFVYADPDSPVAVLRVELAFEQSPPHLGVELRDLLPEYPIDRDGTVTIRARLSTRNVDRVSLRVLDKDNKHVARSVVGVRDGDSNAELRIDDAKPGHYHLLVVAVGAHDRHTQQTYRFSLVSSDAGEPGRPEFEGRKVSAYPDGVGNYSPGEVVYVAETGRFYRVKPFPYSGWANQHVDAYMPGKGYAWQDAWELVQ